MKKLILLISLSTLVLPSFGQRWKDYRQEVFGSVGPSFLLGDVGGAVDKPTNTIRDINFKATRVSLGGGYNYFVRQDMSIVGQFTYNMLTAKDEFAANDARRNRNFDIRTHLMEVSAQYRYYFVKDKFGHSFKLRGASSMFFSQLSAYAAIGVAGFYFNPKGRYSDNKFYALQPLGTEGQGLTVGTEKYKRIGIAIPFSVGAKYSLGKRWGIGAELCIRKTFTDYIDDVSTVYYDNTAIEAEYGERAGFLANPGAGAVPGERRGGEGLDDFYATFMISVNYKLLKGNSIKPRF